MQVKTPPLDPLLSRSFISTNGKTGDTKVVLYRDKKLDVSATAKTREKALKEAHELSRR